MPRPRSVEEIVTKPLEQLGFLLTDPRDRLPDHAATGGHPNLVQWFRDRLVRTTSGQRISVATVNSRRSQRITTTWSRPSGRCHAG